MKETWKKIVYSDYFMGVTLIIIGLILSFIGTIKAEKKVELQGSTYIETTIRGTSISSIQTSFTYKIGENQYPIMLSKNGRAYIKRISKNGKEYNYYLPENISKDLSAKYNIEYKEKVTTIQ